VIDKQRERAKHKTNKNALKSFETRGGALPAGAD
jgi:hypothetical protein